MKFIKLTLSGDTDTPIWINVDTIATLLPKYMNDESDEIVGTYIEHTSDIQGTPVQETPDEILKMINCEVIEK